jgi:alpha-L-rhamnosidase
MTIQERVRGVSAQATSRPGRGWTGQMIAPLSDAGQGTPASFVASSVSLTSVPAEAILHISAQGLYRAFINGVRVGTDLLTPGWTCYDDRIAYQSYDVAALLRQGENRIEIWLADGWYRSQMMWAANPIYNCWGNRIAAIADLVAGGETILATDGSWKSGLLPVRKSGIYHGEDFDARLETLQEMHGVEALAFDTSLLVPHETAPVRELPALQVGESWTDAEGRTVYDFGQNCGGYVRFTVEGEAGATVLMEHAEVLGPNRFFDNRNYRSAAGRTVYTLKGNGPETYAPIFTFQGFRYARVTISGNAKITAIYSVPISSVPERAGGFSSGVAAVDRLVENTVWSQRSNFIEVPTDCPQRDERLGWTGDAQVFAGTACWLADSQTFLRKYLRDVMADQRADGAVPHFSPDPTRLHPIGGRGDWAGSTGWGDAIVIIPWQLYLHYGDKAVLAECFPAMVKWVDYLWSLGEGPIVKTSPVWGSKGFTFGDWLQPVGDNRKPRPTIADDCAATLYHFISTDLAAKIAGLIGQAEAARDLSRRAERIKSAFAHEYIAPSGRLAHHDQTSYALAFLYDLIPPEHDTAARTYFRQAVEDAEYMIGTGFIGTPALLPALSKLGFHDLAEKVFLNRKVPGWLYQVERGATTIWERWDAMAPDGTIYDPDMNSYNHYAYGAVCQWLFEGVAGIAPDAERPGFSRVRIDPVVLPALGKASAWHECGHGKVEAGWTLDGENVRYALTLPDGSEGLLLPSARRGNVAVDGQAVDVPASGLPLTAGRRVITFRMT